MEVALCRAWALHVYTSMVIWKKTTGDKRIYASNTLRKLFLGDAAPQIPANDKQSAEFIKKFEERIDTLFQKPLPCMLSLIHI